MSDPFEALRAQATPAEPDPIFAARLRDRLRRALLEPVGGNMTTATTTSTATTPAAAAGTALSPYLCVDDGRRALAWYAEALGAQAHGEPYVMEDGRIGHAELLVGGSLMMLADEWPELGLLGPKARGGPSLSLHLRVPDVDATVRRAVESGAELERPVADQPYGRSGVFRDPFGHRWMVLTPLGVPEPTGSPELREGDIGYVSLWSPDAARTADFYGAVLGWQYAPSGGHQGSQVVGLDQRIGLWGGQEHRTLFVCFAVSDVHATVQRVREAGGSAEEPAQEPYGLISMCTDDQGMAFAVFEPPGGETGGQSGGPAEPARQGEISYVTIEVPDSGRARAFYGAVLGWEFTAGQAQDGWGVLIGGEQPRMMMGLSGGHDRSTVLPMYSVDDIESAAERVRAAGGSASEPQSRPYGRTADCTDDQGARFHLGQR